ncbi:MAG TPA: alpha/beta hydrolase [Chloroflexota bacterium]|nr:alpha/beta hydrolase [Chloroflexota bacterium]
MDDKFVTVDGIRTRYWEQGSGPALILLHGAALGSSVEVWDSTIGPLASRGLHVYALEWPGWGLTDWPEHHKPSDRPAFVIRFMDELGIAKAAIVGHSMSGNVVVNAAFAYPDRISHIIVLGTGTLLPPLPDKPAPAGGERVSAEPTIQDTRKDISANTFNQAVITDELVKRRHELSVGKNYEYQVRRQEAAGGGGGGTPLWQRLDQIPVPALFLYGREDRGEAGKRTEIARQRYPNLNLHVFDGCKHMVMWDHPDEFVSLTADFVKQAVPA